MLMDLAGIVTTRVKMRFAHDGQSVKPCFPHCVAWSHSWHVSQTVQQRSLVVIVADVVASEVSTRYRRIRRQRLSVWTFSSAISSDIIAQGGIFRMSGVCIHFVL